MKQIVLVGLVLALPGSAARAEIAISHDGVSCVVAERFPRFEARIDPAAEVADARVRFRPTGGLHWYSVRMKREGEGFVGVLPQPKKGLQGFSYYIEVTGSALQSARTGPTAVRYRMPAPIPTPASPKSGTFEVNAPPASAKTANPMSSRTQCRTSTEPSRRLSPVWAGVMPIGYRFGPPADDPRLLPGHTPPAHVTGFKFG